jgi:hypothetical protein
MKDTLMAYDYGHWVTWLVSQEVPQKFPAERNLIEDNVCENYPQGISSIVEQTLLGGDTIKIAYKTVNRKI